LIRLAWFARLAVTARFAWFASGLSGLTRFTWRIALSPLTARFTGLNAFTTGLALLPAFAAQFAAFAAFARFEAAAFAFAFWPEAATAIAISATAWIAFAASALLLRALFALRVFSAGLIVTIATGLGFFAALALGTALVVAFIVAVVEVLLLLHRHCGLHRADKSEIVIGMLRVVFAQHAVPRAGGVSGELQIPLKNVRRRTTNLDLRTVALERAVRMVMPTTTAAAAVVAVVITTTAARLTTTAPLTLHREFTIVLCSPFRATARGQGPAAKCASFQKARSLWSGPCQAAPSAAK